VICRNATDRGRPRTGDCAAGVRTAPGIESSIACDYGQIVEACWTGPNGTLIPLPSAPPAPRLGEKSRIEAEPADHAMGLSRGGIGTKLHLAVEGHGLPLGFVLTAGNRNECPTFEALMSVTKRCRSHCRWPRKLAADKGYSSDKLRRWLMRRRIGVIIPMRDNEHVNDRDCFGRFDKRAYRKRNVVERCVGWLKNCRRICTRFEKLAVNFKAMVTLAMIVLYLKQPL